MMRDHISSLRAACARGARRLIGEERGAGVIWFAAFTLVALLGGTIVIDYGDIVVERRDQQKSADAIVLAGVQELPEETLLADQFAREWGLRNGVDPTEIVDLTLDASCWSSHPDDDPLVLDSISTDISRPANMFLLREFGIGFNVGAHAKGCVGSLIETTGLRPWSVSIFNSECFSLTGGNAANVLDYEPQYGQRCVIRLESPSSQVGSIRLGDEPGDDCSPPGGGASAYKENIVEGSDALCAIGEIIATEPGLQVGPTFTAVEDMLALEGACDTNPNFGNTNGYDELLEVFTANPSDVAPGPNTIFTPRNCGWDTDPGTPDSPRFVTLVLIDQFDKPNGFDTEPIIAFAGFFIEGCEVVEGDGSLTAYPQCDMKNSDRANAQIVGTFVQHLKLGGAAGVLNPFGTRTYALVE